MLLYVYTVYAVSAANGDASPPPTGLSPPLTGAICSIADHGAIADNATLATASIQSAIDMCHAAHPNGSTVLVPRGAYKTAGVLLRSNMRFHLERGAGLYGSTDPDDYSISQQWFGGHYVHNFNALIRGANVTNVSVTGSNMHLGPAPAASASIVDGVGWRWWCQASCIPLLKDQVSRLWCDAMNPDNSSLPVGLLPEPRGAGRPRLVNFYNSSGVLLQGFTAQNSPHWTTHIQYSRDVVVQNLTVLSPREVGNTDGIDPDSVVNMLITDSYVSVGDDGVSIKSDNITLDDGRNAMMPTRNITMRRLQIRSRNWCIGSSTFGGVVDILFEDSTIGDPHDDVAGQVPWAFKFKSHEYFPGSIENVTVRRINVGAVKPTPWMYPASRARKPLGAFALGLTYAGKAPVHRSGVPRARNITFEDIYIKSAQAPGSIVGLPESCFQGLRFVNVSFGAIENSSTWGCKDVDAESFVHVGVVPPFGTCQSTATGTCANGTVW